MLTILAYDMRAWEYMVAYVPRKLVEAALQRDNRLEYLDYGVSIRRCWLTPKGQALVQLTIQQLMDMKEGVLDGPRGSA